MNKTILTALVLILTGCSAFQPAAPQPTAEPPTPVILVQTVMVMVTPTSPPPTPIPTDTPAPPAPTLPPPTDTSAPLGAPTSLGAPTLSGPISVPVSLNGSVFTNITVSSNWFSLRCHPKTITFDLYTTDVYITQVELYYRIRDKHSTVVPEWSRAASLETDGGNHFWLTYGAEDVKPDNRKRAGWFDFQFVGVNKVGDVVGRSQRIEGLVSFYIDCP